MYKFIELVINTRKWVNILFSLPIECTIVNCHSHLLNLLPNEDEWSTPWTLGWLNQSLSQVFIYLPFHLCWLSCRHFILMSVVRLSIGEKFNVMHSISIHRHAWWIKDIMEFLNYFILSKRDLDISMPFCLTVTNHLPGDKFTVRL